VGTVRTIALAVGWLVAAALVSAVTAVTVLAIDDDGGGATVTQAAGRAGTPAATTDGLSISEVYDGAKDSVVVINAESQLPEATPFGNEGQTAQGSGFVYDDAGHVVTNYHVVQGADNVTVTFPDGEEVPADVVGTDPSTDVAVLELQEDVDAEPLPLGDSDALDVGETVVAIGSPFGLQGTVTSGIVSAVDRTITSPDENRFGIDQVIQTDAAINSGNSGGPLLDTSGRVVGINTQIQSGSGGNDGIGYAVPSNTVRDIAQQLIETGEAEHAYLGVSMTQTDDGVQIEEVSPDGPAEGAGVEAGDVVTAVDGEAVDSPDDLRAAVEAKQPGDELELQITRDGDEQTVTVELGERPTDSTS
jgi:putative serine protease PepD